MKITINHVRQAMMCTRGARVFVKRHGGDWGDFLKNGIDEERVLGTDDAMARKVVDLAHAQENANG